MDFGFRFVLNQGHTGHTPTHTHTHTTHMEVKLRSFDSRCKICEGQPKWTWGIVKIRFVPKTVCYLSYFLKICSCFSGNLCVCPPRFSRGKNILPHGILDLRTTKRVARIRDRLASHGRRGIEFPIRVPSLVALYQPPDRHLCK